MLTSYDDFPLHQACVPIADTATSDVNHYDRYFFNGYTADGSLYFGLAMGLYPNRHVADAAFSVARGGTEQISVFASRRAPVDRRDANIVGPITVEVIEPLRVLRVVVDAPEHALRADLVFTARSDALEEPHFFQRSGVRVMLDFTRLTQFGRWDGWIDVDGERIDVHSDAVTGSRDRSWGVRPVGEPAQTGAPVGAPQYFWLWAPINFDTFATHFDVNEYADGRRWHEVGAKLADGAAGQMMRTVDFRITWKEGTRYASSFEYDLAGWDGSTATVSLEPLFNFQMCGIGYGHPQWSHGTWQGESAVGGERLGLPVDDPVSRTNVHVQSFSRATYRDDTGAEATGCGVLELLCVGNHVSGLTGILDGYGL